MAIVKPVLNDPTVGGSRGVWGNTLNENHTAQDSFNGDVADRLNRYEVYTSLADMGLTDDDLTNGDLEASMITIFTAMQEESRLLMDVTASDPNFLSILPHEGAITILKGSPNVATIMLETEGNGRFETSYDGTLVTKVEAFINLKTGKEDTFSKNTAFNKDFGNIAGTVIEGDDVGDVSILDTTSKEVVGATNELHGEINAIDNRIKNIEFDKVIEMDNSDDLQQTSTHRRLIIKQTLQLLGFSTIINLLPIKNIVFSQSQESAILSKISTQKDFMKKAFKMKQIAIDTGDQAFGAIIVKQGNVVGLGPSKVLRNVCPISSGFTHSAGS